MAWEVPNIIINLEKKIKEIGSSIPGPATTDKAGIVKPDGSSITVTSDGTINAAIPGPATTSTAGIVKPDGSTITVTSDGTISADISRIGSVDGEYLSCPGSDAGVGLIHKAYGMSIQDGTPSTSDPVDIVSAKANFQSVGKNILWYPYDGPSPTTHRSIIFTVNADGCISYTGTPESNTATYTCKTYTKLKAGSYTVSNIDSTGHSGVAISVFGNSTGGAYTGEYSGLYGSGTNLSVWTTQSGAAWSSSNSFGYENTFTIAQDAYVVVQLRTVTSAVVSGSMSGVACPMLRLAFVTDSSYEPYISSTVTTNIILRAIEVTSSDTYNLAYNDKYYVADTLDWSDGYTITRRIGNIDSYDSEEIPTKWLSSKDVYSEGGTISAGANVIYILTSSTTESVSDANAEKLLGIKTYDEATTITTTSTPAVPETVIEYPMDRVAAIALTAHNKAFS